jgi:hypothetical protein
MPAEFNAVVDAVKKAKGKAVIVAPKGRRRQAVRWIAAESRWPTRWLAESNLRRGRDRPFGKAARRC